MQETQSTVAVEVFYDSEYCFMFMEQTKRIAHWASRLESGQRKIKTIIRSLLSDYSYHVAIVSIELTQDAKTGHSHYAVTLQQAPSRV